MVNVWSAAIPTGPAFPVVVAVCPPPGVDGSEIFFGSTCTLIAADGTVYKFDGVGPTNAPNQGTGNWEFTANGVPQTSAIALERHTSGQIYYLATLGPVIAPIQLWFLWTSSDKPQAVTPASGPVGNLFQNQTTGVTYRTANAMLSAAAANNTLLIPLMPNGIAQWWDCGVVTAAGVTVNGTTGTIIGGADVQSKAALLAQANNVTFNNLTVANNNDGQDSSGIRADATFHGLTVNNCTVHTCDNGILTSPSTGGTTTITNTTIFECGDTSGFGSVGPGQTHNVYIGNEDNINVQNVISYRTVSEGHCFKTRAKAGTLGTTSGNIFAQLGGLSTCAIDIPCGGTYLVANSILHRGPNAENNRFTTFGVEIPNGPSSCDMTGRSQSLIFDNCWFIDDGPLNSSTTQICSNLFSSTGVIVNLRNGCRIVSNPLTSPVIFGANVSDDGSTKHYASRAAAIAAGENIPAAYSDSLSCLPPIPTPPSADKLTVLLNSMTVGTWANAGDATTLANAGITGVTAPSPSNVTPSPVPTNVSGPSSVTRKWSSGFLDTNNKQLVLFGGGHQDYAGNEVYGFSLKTLNWTLLHQPSPNSAIPAVGAAGIDPYSDGLPASRHTYNGLAFNPSTGEFLIAGGFIWGNPGGGSSKTWKYNLGTNSWIQTGSDSNLPAEPMGAIDTVNQIAYFYDTNGSQLQRYRFSTGTWDAIFMNQQAFDFHQTCAWCPTTSQIYGTGAGFTYTINPTTAQTVNHTQTTGALACQNYGNPPGFTFHAPSGNFVGMVPGDSALYFLNPSTFAWTKHSAAAGNTVTPPAETADSNGVWGRFVYDSAHNCFLTITDYDSTVFVYKPDF